MHRYCILAPCKSSANHSILDKMRVEFFNYQAWIDAFAACGIDPDFYTVRGYDENEILPWDTIDVGVSKKFLLNERHQAYAGKVTPDCRHGCSGCGASKLLKEVPCDA